MATLRDIRRRIGTVKSTMQITSAMRMISAAKLARGQSKVKQALPYSHALQQLATGLFGTGDVEHPLLKASHTGKVVLVLFASDRGLAGPFNNQILKLAAKFVLEQQTQGEEVVLWVFGRKGDEYFRRRGIELECFSIQEPEPVRAQKTQQAAQKCMEGFLNGEVKRAFIAYNHFQNPITQNPKISALLPISPEIAPKDAPGGGVKETLFEPSKQEVLDELLPSYVRNQLLLAHLNTEAGEHGARMVAMEGATKNAGDMVARLTLQYNRARQASITSELIEIINGAQAL